MRVVLRQNWKGRSWLVAGVLVIITGCATIDPSLEYVRTAEKVEQATGHNGLNRAFDESNGTKQRVDDLLDRSLSLEESVELCLLNNARLQTALLEVGLSHAELVQSGLLSNPSLNGLIRLPVDGGQSAIEAGIVQNLIELWQIPAKKRLAKKALESTVMRIAYEAARTVVETKAAYYTTIAAKEILAVEKQNVDTTKTFLELVTAQQQSGSATEVDVNAARAEVLEQEVTLRSAQLAFFESKRKLAILLGLELSPNDLDLSDPLLPLPHWTFDVPRLIDLAKGHRLDLQAATENVLTTQQALSLEKRLFLRNASAGAGLESEGSNITVGPAIRLQVPVFDQNQAQIAKAEIRYAQASQTLKALTVEVIQQVRGAQEGFLAARDIARSYKERILPLAENSLELAQESFRAGKTGVLSVLIAQRKLLSARRDYFQKLEQLAYSVINIEAAIGMPVSKLLDVERKSPL